VAGTDLLGEKKYYWLAGGYKSFVSKETWTED